MNAMTFAKTIIPSKYHKLFSDPLSLLSMSKPPGPNQLTETKKMFVQWNAERLSISNEDSLKRYLNSLQSLKGGHAGRLYRSFNNLNYKINNVFFSDNEAEVYDAYQFFGPMLFLRMLSYPEPVFSENDLIVKEFENRSSLTIIDYGCGLAQRSRSLTNFLTKKRYEL